MTTETGTLTPTDEDMQRAYDALYNGPGHMRDYDELARAVLATIGPIIERERRAAKVEALRDLAIEFRARAEGAPDSGSWERCARIAENRAYMQVPKVP